MAANRESRLELRAARRLADESDLPRRRVGIYAKAALVDDDVVVVPTEAYEILGVGDASFGPVHSVVSLESVLAGAARCGAAAISADDEAAKAGRYPRKPSTDVERSSVVPDPDDLRRAGAHELVQSVGPNGWPSGQIPVRSEASVDEDRQPAAGA